MPSAVAVVGRGQFSVVKAVVTVDALGAFDPRFDFLYSDISFTVYSDGAELGELKISKGSLDWRPAGYHKPVRWR